MSGKEISFCSLHCFSCCTSQAIRK